MIYPEAIQFLYDLRLFGAKFGLENTFQLAALAGNPQYRLRFIHVAGTNGKGSTCAMLESIYRAAGLRVGLFTSPHLVSFRERIQVNRRPIGQDDVVRLLDEMKPSFKHFPDGHQPTFFEVVTVMALKFFAEQKCDLVIWETGLGGRLDATNIVNPLACVITNIQLDHQQWLGGTLAKIAAEKAGIIKAGIPVVTATDEPEALAVIQRIVQEKNTRLTIIRNSEFGIRNSELSLLGDHQQLNAALALATVGILQKQIPISDEQILAGLANVNWPGRLQLVTRGVRQKILLDGAHNPAGAQTLAETLKKNFPAERPTLLLGVFQDKDWRHICEILAPLAARIVTVPVASERSANPEELAEVCRRTHPSADVLVCRSPGEALDRTAGDRFVVITGSLYLVGETLELLGLSPAGSDERGLNEWAGTPRVPVPG